MITIAQNRWDECSRWFNEDECVELQSASLGSSTAPRGFVVDETQLSEILQAKVRFHFLESNGRIGRGASF